MKNENSTMREFVEWAGNQTQAAKRLGVTRQAVGYMLRGKYAVTPALAQKAQEVSDGRFRRESFIWPE